MARGVSGPVAARWFREGGGMPSLSLVPMYGRYLSFAEREELALLHARGVGVREIGRRIDRSAPRISRELRRNAATHCSYLQYRASTAQWDAERRARRPKTAKLATHDGLRQYVQDRLAGTVTAGGGFQPWSQRGDGTVRRVARQRTWLSKISATDVFLSVA